MKPEKCAVVILASRTTTHEGFYEALTQSLDARIPIVEAPILNRGEKSCVMGRESVRSYENEASMT